MNILDILLSDFKWYRKLRGGKWLCVWYDYKFQGGYEIWRRNVEISWLTFNLDFDRIIGQEDYGV